MDFFTGIAHNKIILVAACGWLVAQILKTAIHLFISKEFVAERLVGSGGMPSSHSATVCALATATCYEYGSASFEFAIALFLPSLSCMTLWACAGKPASRPSF